MPWFLAAKAFFGRIPRGVWISLAAAAALGAIIWWHNHTVSNARKEGYAAGVKAEGDRIAKKAEKWVEQINDIAAKQRSKNSEANRRIDRAADALLLRGPGKAACLNPAAPAASRHQPASGASDAAVAPVPDRERVDLFGLPFAPTIEFGRICDANRQEVIDRREAEKLQLDAWKKGQSGN